MSCYNIELSSVDRWFLTSGISSSVIIGRSIRIRLGMTCFFCLDKLYWYRDILFRALLSLLDPVKLEPYHIRDFWASYVLREQYRSDIAAIVSHQSVSRRNRGDNVQKRFDSVATDVVAVQLRNCILWSKITRVVWRLNSWFQITLFD